MKLTATDEVATCILQKDSRYRYWGAYHVDAGVYHIHAGGSIIYMGGDEIPRCLDHTWRATKV